MPKNGYGNPHKATKRKPKNGSGGKGAPNLPHGVKITSRQVILPKEKLEMMKPLDVKPFEKIVPKRKRNGAKRNKQVMAADRHPM